MNECSTSKQQIEKEAGIVLTDNWEKEFYELINHLANTNFEKLVYLLYRIDVNENKITALLNNKSDTNAGDLIAAAILERLEEKKVTRAKYQQSNDGSEEEKW
jgi:hypothetical protein